MNRIIKRHDFHMIYIPGAGHGGPALVVNVYPDGRYTELHPDIKPVPPPGA